MNPAIGNPAAMLAIWIALSPPAISRAMAIAPSRMHQSRRILCGGLALPMEFNVHSTWVPESAEVMKYVASRMQTSTLSTLPSVPPSILCSRVNMAAVVSCLVASNTVPPSNLALSPCSSPLATSSACC
ncbi:hypothetical protein D3C71_1853880 [compost metagenome]